jgi:hypothetical protein
MRIVLEVGGQSVCDRMEAALREMKAELKETTV